MPEPSDDPFRKIQEELRDVDTTLGENPDLHERVRKLMEHEDDLDSEDAQVQRLQSQVSHIASAPAPDTDEFDASLKRLEAQVGQGKNRRAAEAKAIADERAARGRDAKGMGVGLTLAYVIVGVPLVGAFFGWLLDMALNTNIMKGLGALTGAVVGLGIAVVMMNKATSNL